MGLAHVRLAKIHRALGDFACAQTLSEKATEILGELARAQPDVADYQSDLATSYFELGAVYFDIGRFDRAETAFQQALAIQTKLAADHPVVAEYRRALATTQIALGRLCVRAGQFDKAHESLEKGLPIWSQLAGNNAHVAEDRDGLASVQLTLGIAYGARGLSEKRRRCSRKRQILIKHWSLTARTFLSTAIPWAGCRALGSHYFVSTRQAEKAEAGHRQACKSMRSWPKSIRMCGTMNTN